MKSIEEILANTDFSSAISKITAQRKRKPFVQSFEEMEREYNPYSHKVMDKHIRKDKKIKVRTDKLDHKTGEPVYKDKTVPRCRVTVPIQRVLVERSVGFLFGIPVEYKIVGSADNKAKKLFDEVISVMRKCKMKYFDKKLARTLFRSCECAELWYFETNKDGKPEKMKVRLLSPLKGDELYPHFNAYDDMDGFGRKYSSYDEEGNSTQHFDVYTSALVYRYALIDGDWKLLEQPQDHGFGKIPVIYYRQEETEWYTVQNNIERVEELLSNWGDTDDYFGTPSYFFKGKLKGFAEKGEVGRVYQGEGSDTDMKVMSWDSSPESMKQELSNLLNIIFSYTQTPDISFEVMKTLGSNTSGVALRLMLTDPHMKADMKIELFGEMFTRRFNLIKAGITTSKTSYTPQVADSLEAEPIFTPYLPKNELEEIQIINASTGGKATMSQKEGIRQNPRVSDPETIIAELTEEAQTEAVLDSFGSAE